MAPSDRLRSSSAAKRKGSRKGSAKAAPPPPKQGLSKAAKRAATVAAKKAKDREVEDQDDASDGSSEVDEESGDKDSGGDDGTGSSSSSGSDISEDTMALVKQIDDRRAAKKRKLAGKSTAVVTASAAKTSVDKAARKALSNDAAVAKEKRKKSRDTLGRIIAKIGTGTVAEKASLKISGLPKARKATSSKKDKRKAPSSPEAEPSSDEDGEEDDDVVELPAVPATTRRIRTTVNKLISWLSKSTFTLLPTPLPAFALAEGHLSLVYTASLLTASAWYPPGAQPTYEMYLGLLEVVQRSLPQLFTGSPDNLPIANLHVFEIMTNFKAQLDQAFRILEGQQVLIDLTFGAFITQLCADGHAFDPVAAVVKLMSTLSNSVAARKTKTSINDSCNGSRASSTVSQHQHRQQRQQQQQPSGGGKGSAGTHKGGGKGGGKNGQQRPPPPPGLPGMVWLGSYGAWCRQPYDSNGTYLKHACVKCGAGSIAPNPGHHGTACLATVAEKADWLQHARAVR
jgi:hypothetical protein